MKKIFISILCLLLCIVGFIVPCSATVTQTLGWVTLPTFADIDKTDMRTISYTAKIGVSYATASVEVIDVNDLELENNSWYKSYRFVNHELLTVAQLGDGWVLDTVLDVYSYEFELVLKVPTTYEILNGVISHDTQLLLWSPKFENIRIDYIYIEPLRVPTYYPMKNSSCEYDVYFQTNVWIEEANALESLPLDDLFWNTTFPYINARFEYQTLDEISIPSSNVNAFTMRNHFLRQKNKVIGGNSFNLKSLLFTNKMSVTSDVFQNTYETYYFYTEQSYYFETAKYIYIGIDFKYEDGLTIIPNGSQTGLGVDFSTLYMPVNLDYDDSGNIAQDIQNFFAYLFTETLPNIINNFVVWFMVEAPLINKVTGPLYLAAIQTKNIVAQWLLPLLTSVGIFGSIIAVIIFIKLLRRLLK